MPKKTTQGKGKKPRSPYSYEFLLVEYLKEISNEITYLMLIVASLFLFMIIDFIPTSNLDELFLLKMIFGIMILGGFLLYGVSAVTKRRIEKHFERIFGLF